MDYTLHTSNAGAIVEWAAPISSTREATDLIAACAENDTDRLLIDSGVLPPEFFQLHTLFAGEFLQKLQNYQLRTAVVIPVERDYGERFEEYLLEAQRARFSRLFTSRDEALAWLAEE